MLSTPLSRPKNTVVNHLGKGVTWKSPLTGDFGSSSFANLNNIFFERFIRLLWVSGVFYRWNPFSHPLFILHTITSLPIIREDQISRYFRWYRIKVGSQVKTRRQFLARRYLTYLHITEFFIYRLASKLLILLYMHIPEPIKRFNTDYTLVSHKIDLSTIYQKLKLFTYALHKVFLITQTELNDF